MSRPTTDPAAEAKIAREVERVYREWDEALGAKDVDAAMALYHPDTTLESPLVCHLLDRADGVVSGRDQLRGFVERVFAHQPPERRRYRTGYLAEYRPNGALLTWEYPRVSPDGEQMDLVEVMEIQDGMIMRHRVYWGWRSVGMLTSGAHPR